MKVTIYYFHFAEIMVQWLKSASATKDRGGDRLRVKISADSTCDLPKAFIEEYEIGIIPLSIVKDGVPHRDGLEISPDEIFSYTENGGGSCQTTAINVAEYHEVFLNYLNDYDAVVHINIGSGFSACHQNAKLVADELKNIYVIDSENLCVGMGYPVLEAAQMARAGRDAAEIAGWLDGVKDKVELSFVISTLDYLRRGGRCSALAAFGANLLGLKPAIELVDGKLGVGKKYRGAISKIVEQYMTDQLAGRTDIDTRGAFIVSAGMPDDIVEIARRVVREDGRFDKVYESEAGCTISSHCGPGTLGLMFYRK